LKKLKIKICGIKDISILSYCESLYIDYCGLVFFKKSPRNVDIEKAKHIINYGKKLKISPVGVFFNHEINDLINIIYNTKLKVIQLHGSENNDYIIKLKEKNNLKIIKNIALENEKDLIKIKEYPNADFFLFDYKAKKNELPGGNAKSFNWSILKSFKIKKPWFISGGINSKNINEILNNLNPYGIDISSGVEGYPGEKSKRKIKEIVKLINE
tara:strand:- start:920 stop:1558 length:639 start_codon:yes stop_codon:yes gene_type:complete